MHLQLRILWPLPDAPWSGRREKSKRVKNEYAIQAMKAKRARNKARDEAERLKQQVESGEQTDWQQAMQEWNEWEKQKD